MTSNLIRAAFGKTNHPVGTLVTVAKRPDLGTGCVIANDGIKRKVSFLVKDSEPLPIPSFLDPGHGSNDFPAHEEIHVIGAYELQKA